MSSRIILTLLARTRARFDPLFVSALWALAVGAGCDSASDKPSQDAKRDAGSDAELPAADASKCPVEQPEDDCGECGGDGSSCLHPLTGSYAARTQFYARQRTSVQGMTLDLVSKGALLSLVDIDKRGIATEHYCFLEIASAEGVVSWTSPGALQQVPDTALPLEVDGDEVVRPLTSHQGRFSWSPENAPADCVVDQRHASGCLCVADEALPTRPDDCRVTDIDSDDKPGGKMYLTLGALDDLDSTDAPVKLNVVALLNLGWRLPGAASNQLVGSIEGGIQQAELSREGELSGALGEVRNAMCSDADGRTLGHVELVRGDFTCSSLLAGRATDAQSYGVFDESLDGEAPDVDACPNPDCLDATACPAP